jgi:FtsP/CotA-like multicopper oxidase with cupredoxin domain
MLVPAAGPLLWPAVVRGLKRTAVALAVLLVAVGVGYVGKLWWDSRLPETYNVMDYGSPSTGGGVPVAHEAHRGSSVTALEGPVGVADARFTLTARQTEVRLASGRAVDAMTFDGRVPGPELRVQRGDLVEVTLRNKDIESGVTIHWHGVDVPNAEDGVAGVTQDAVLPGEGYTYRFRAEQEGTFWYHTHQIAAKEVRRGLYGSLVIEPPVARRNAVDLVVVAHTFDGVPVLGDSDVLEHRAVSPGAPVRLRLVNSDNTPQRFALSGTPFRVLALDGTDLHGPTPLENVSIEVPAGGRADLGFTMPASPVRLSLESSQAALVLSSDGRGELSATDQAPTFDPLHYGTPAATPFGASSAFDRRFELEIGRKPGFFDGRPGMQWTINGRIYPDVPVFLVDEGDLVEVTISNTASGVHPMHLHGHHLLVLSRDGEPASGSPWWVDTLNVEKDERYVVAFRADNPGIWMDHCHNLRHAEQGLTMHVAYSGITTPFAIGDDAHNEPE